MGQSGVTKRVVTVACLIIIGGFFLGYHSVHAIDEHIVQHQAAVAQQKKTNEAQQLENQLASAWQNELASNPPDGDVDVALYDNATGAVAHFTKDPDSDSFITASVVKLSILDTMLLENQKNGISGISSDQMQYAAPMIKLSDNDSATSLWYEVGGSSAVNSFYRQIGATNSQASSDHWGWSATTAEDQLKVMNQIAYPKLLNSSSVSAANNLLDQVVSSERWGVSAGVPSSATIRLKNGWLDPDDTNDHGWVVNSVGHISGNGADYTIAVLTDSNTTEQDGIDTIQGLSTTAWNTLHAIKG